MTAFRVTCHCGKDGKNYYCDQLSPVAAKEAADDAAKEAAEDAAKDAAGDAYEDTYREAYDAAFREVYDETFPQKYADALERLAARDATGPRGSSPGLLLRHEIIPDRGGPAW
jgi:hypothetical protein